MRLPLPLARDEVHVWRAVLDAAGTPLGEYEAVLSTEEHNRSTRFHFSRDRLRYVITHGVLRELLALYTGCSASDLPLETTSFGKPVVPGSKVEFNLSRSGDVALFAFARHSVGVDIEQVRPLEEAQEIAARFFSAPEASLIRRLPESLQLKAFFRCWTRKEAYIKARGEGLGIPLDSFAVSIEEDRAALLQCDSDPEAPAHWALSALNPGEGYVAALAVEHGFSRLSEWNWD